MIYFYHYAIDSANHYLPGRHGIQWQIHHQERPSRQLSDWGTSALPSSSSADPYLSPKNSPSSGVPPVPTANTPSTSLSTKAPSSSQQISSPQQRRTTPSKTRNITASSCPTFSRSPRRLRLGKLRKRSGRSWALVRVRLWLRVRCLRAIGPVTALCSPC